MYEYMPLLKNAVIFGSSKGASDEGGRDEGVRDDGGRDEGVGARDEEMRKGLRALGVTSLEVQLSLDGVDLPL